MSNIAVSFEKERKVYIGKGRVFALFKVWISVSLHLQIQGIKLPSGREFREARGDKVMGMKGVKGDNKKAGRGPIVVQALFCPPPPPLSRT